MIVTTAQGTNCDNTSRWAKNLPTSRYNYIASHPCTQIERLHASDKMIGPTWGKITRSVWDGSSDLCGGYGRRLQRSSISRDAPTYFADPIHTFHASTPPPGRVATITRAMPRERIHNESSYVLPGGQSILNVAKDAESMGPTSSKKNAYRRYCHDNMTLLANIVHQDTGRRTPIDWNYEKEGTAGEQLPVQLTTSRTSRIYLNKSPYPADSTIGTRSTTNALTSGRKTGSARSSRSHNNNNNNNNSSSSSSSNSGGGGDEKEEKRIAAAVAAQSIITEFQLFAVALLLLIILYTAAYCLQYFEVVH